jgi:acetyl-CoA acetyltransferase
VTPSVTLAGWSGRGALAPGEGIADAVSDAVRAALAKAGLTLDHIDMVVTCASDLVDGAMVATRSGIAGSYHRELITVPSSAGHAFAAAATQIESGAAQTVLLAGWGEGSKRAARDSRIVEADPFYTRPLGADATALAALQAQRLVADGRLDPDLVCVYRDTMTARSKRDASSHRLRWLRPHWVDGVAALVLRADKGGIALKDLGRWFEPYCPPPDRLDPALWIAATGTAIPPLAALEIGAPTPFAEAIAVADLLRRQGWAADDPRFNVSGGGAVSHFGPATGLQRIITVAERLAHTTGGGVGAAIDLAGPIGQAVTVILLEAGHA